MMEYLEVDLLTYLHQFVWEGLSTLGGTIPYFFLFFQFPIKSRERAKYGIC